MTAEALQPPIRAFTQASQDLLRPIKLGPNDRLAIRITKELDKFLVHSYSTRSNPDGTAGVPTYSFVQDHQWLDRIPEREQTQLGDQWTWWSVAATDYAVQVITALWPRDRIDFDDDARQVFDYVMLTVRQQECAAEAYAQYRQELPGEAEAGEIVDPMTRRMMKWPPPQVYEGRLELHPDNPLAGYQQCAAYLSSQNEGFGLFMEQGTGKTPTVIAEVCNLSKQFDRPLRVLIVCPKNVRQNWFKEFCKFATEPGEVTVIRGGLVRRLTQLCEAFTLEEGAKYTVVVCSYESIDKTWQAIGNIQWDLCVLDEAHMICSTYTKRFTRMMELRDICDRRRVLTGTPMRNTPLDLYALFEFMGRGFSGFTSWKAWKKFFGVYERQGQHDVMVAVQNLPLMQERMARLSFQVRKSEALPNLPSKVYDVVEVEMTKVQAEAYEKLSKQLALEIEAIMERESNKQLVVNNVLTKLLRLAQVTSGFISWDPDYDPETGVALGKRQIEFFDPNPKLEALVSELRDQFTDPDSKVIIWASWVPDILAIRDRLALEGIRAVTFYGGTSDEDRVEAERAFNFDPDCRVFLGNPAAGGTGLNLLGYPPGDGESYTTDVDREIYYSQGWSATVRSQSEDRAHRRGTRKNVRITDLCVANTVDEQIRERVMQKIITALEVSDVRAILKAVLHGVERDDD